MNRTRNLISLVLIVAAVAISSCASEASNGYDTDLESEGDPLLLRPRLDKPVARPLGRVLLRWQAIEGAGGYLLQMSSDESFEPVEKSWTIRGLNIEIPIEAGSTAWFRIRAFDGSDVSRWSQPVSFSEVRK